MSIDLEIKLKKANKVYFEDEMISGVISLKSNSDFKHEGITLTAEGNVNLQLSAKSVGVIEAFYQSVKPIQLVSTVVDIAAPGKIPAGLTDIPFEFPLSARGSKKLFESYHGVFVSVQYYLRADMKRPFLAKDISKTCELIVEYNPSTCEKATVNPVQFAITPNSLKNVGERKDLPRFLVRGNFDSTVCCIARPFTGEIVIEHCSIPVKSVELQLVRVETCGCAEGYARDATEIQNIQIGEGNVMCHLPIPVYMIFPRLFTCPTLSTSNFKIEFEINIVIIFDDDHLITENFPVVLTRS